MRGVQGLSSALLLVVLAVAPSAGAPQCDSPIDLGQGTVNFHVPESYDPAEPAPLVIMLHGRGGNAWFQERYLRLTPMADRFGFLYAYPDGSPDPMGVLMWNGTDACCDFGLTGVDHSGYLRSLIEAIEAQCNVDPRKIFFTGHSNGGFMSYRMVCDHADRVAAIASLAGATYLDPADCRPTEPVHVLQIHGTWDGVIRYEGGTNGGVRYPGAVESVEIWAGYNDCRIKAVDSPRGLDLDSELAGAETLQSRYTDSCSPGGSAELWTIDRGGHAPALTSTYARAVSEFLLAHPKTGRCTGAERVVVRKCTRSNTLVLKLRAGLERDGYRVELSGGETDYGVLNGRGRTKVRFRRLPDGEGSAKITFGCGAVEDAAFVCG